MVKQLNISYLEEEKKRRKYLKKYNKMTVKITAAAVNVKFKRLFLFVFAYNCILAHIIDACNYCKYIGNGSMFYKVKRLAT